MLQSAILVLLLGLALGLVARVGAVVLVSAVLVVLVAALGLWHVRPLIDIAVSAGMGLLLLQSGFLAGALLPVRDTRMVGKKLRRQSR